MAAYTGWSSDQDGDFRTAGKVHNSLPAGVYKTWLSTTTGQFYFRRLENPADKVVSLPGLPCDYLCDQIDTFWGRASAYTAYNFLHKRGILMYGPPGCGKTSVINLLTQAFISKYNGIVVQIIDFIEAPRCLMNLRQCEPDRPIMTLMEDVEGVFSGQNGTAQVQAALSFLDGQMQLNHIVHLATTNKPEELEDRFIKRPGRFDVVVGIHAPMAETREAYLRHVTSNMIPESKLRELVESTEGLGLSYLRELASSFLCLDIPLNETLDRLKLNFKTKSLLSKGTPKMGFSIGFDGD